MKKFFAIVLFVSLVGFGSFSAMPAFGQEGEVINPPKDEPPMWNEFRAVATGRQPEDIKIFGSLEAGAYGVELEFKIVPRLGELVEAPDVRVTVPGAVHAVNTTYTGGAWSYRVVIAAPLGFVPEEKVEMVSINLRETKVVVVRIEPGFSLVVGADWVHGGNFLALPDTMFGGFEARWIKVGKIDLYTTNAARVGDEIQLEVLGGTRPLGGDVIIRDGNGNSISSVDVLRLQVQSDDNGKALLSFIVVGHWMANASTPYVVLDASRIIDANGVPLTSYTGDVYVYPLTGDVNGNGQADFTDAVGILTALANHQVIPPAVFRAADVSGNGVVTIYDAVLILMHQPEEAFPADTVDKGAPSAKPVNEAKELKKLIAELDRSGYDTSQLRELEGVELTLTPSGSAGRVSPAGKTMTTWGAMKAR